MAKSRRRRDDMTVPCQGIAAQQTPKRRDAHADYALDSAAGGLTMFSKLRNRGLPLVALALAAVLGGCVAYPAYPEYGGGYYGGGYYGAPVYSGGVVAFGGGWHGHGWRGHHRRGDW
jgi:hypothetical protein